MKKGKSLFMTFAVAMLAGVLALTATGCQKKSGFSQDKNVTVVTRDAESGTRSAFMEIIGLKGKPNVSNAVVAASTAAVLQEVKSNPHAIAFDSLGYVTDEVKILKVDGVAPTVAGIKDGSYKISRPLSIVFKQENVQSGANKVFYDFLMSKTAQDIVVAQGYAGLDSTSEFTVQPNASGTINVSGSTSLEPLMKELVKKFESLQSQITVTVSGGGSGQGLSDAENGVSEFGMISKVFKQSDAPSCQAKEVAYDGIAVIVNKENPLDNITLEQLKNVYDNEAGENGITKWNQLVG
ncbi:MAG: substrate-binding domain-containing protein [Christensenellaceae bacterium]